MTDKPNLRRDFFDMSASHTVTAIRISAVPHRNRMSVWLSASREHYAGLRLTAIG